MKAILGMLQLPAMSDASAAKSFDEIQQLLEGLDYSVSSRIIQKRSHRSASTYFGEGKISEIAALTGGPGTAPRGPDSREVPLRSDLTVVVDDELSPGQLRYLRAAFAVEVLDRVSVILRIFEQRAQTREAKLEVELAKLEHELPRIRDDHSLGDREGGGGRASRGHTNVELAKQRARERMAAIRRDLERLRSGEEKRILTREGVLGVAIVGYTNAGKSSIMRQLTGSDVLVEDKLFATLGTTTRQLSPASVPPVLLTDTVGFISRLPHGLIASFRSTLAEAREASLLLHIVDASDPDWRLQHAVTEGVLRDIGLGDKPVFLILNKIDRLDPGKRNNLRLEFPNALQINALHADDGRMLREKILECFAGQLIEARLSIPYAKQGIFSEMRKHLQVLDETYEETIVLRVRGRSEVLAKLKAYIMR